MFDCRTNRTPIERLGSIGFWFGFVRLTTPGIMHAERSYSRPTNIQETNVMFNVNFQEEFMEREIKLRPLLKHASYHN